MITNGVPGVIMADRGHYAQRVWPATRSQAKCRAYQDLGECFNNDATAMLTFTA